MVLPEEQTFVCGSDDARTQLCFVVVFEKNILFSGCLCFHVSYLGLSL